MLIENYVAVPCLYLSVCVCVCVCRVNFEREDKLLKEVKEVMMVIEKNKML